MIKFTKEEISLCKQVAERHRKSLVKGDWYWNEEWKAKEMVIAGMTIKNQKLLSCFKLWTISDCLEFLEEHGFTYTLHFITKKRGYELILFDGQKRPRIFEGGTRKIVCLKAVLAVLEEESK